MTAHHSYGQWHVVAVLGRTVTLRRGDQIRQGTWDIVNDTVTITFDDKAGPPITVDTVPSTPEQTLYQIRSFA